MALRTSTSILLLSVLVAGILSPPGLCALMCGRRYQAETRHHCGHPSDPMSGMMHHHSAMMNHPDLDAVMPASCPSNCDAVERLNLSRTTAQVKVRQTGIVSPDAAAKFMTPDIGTAWCSDGGPPVRRTACTASFSVLRI
ncbi:MAG: hypothetical protein WCF26_18245 [Candidatus Sulfotelmatobacter sp.]